MKSSNKGAVYISSPQKVKTARKNRFSLIVTAFLALVFFALAAGHNITQPGQTAAPAQAEGLGFCEFGQGMGDRGGWDALIDNYPAGKATNRTVTGQEAFGENMWFVRYYGEGKGNVLIATPSEKRAAGLISNSNKTRLADHRNGSTCFGTALTFAANGGIGLASTVSSVASWISTYAFKTNLICEDARDNPVTEKCVQLLRVLGGTSTAGVSSEGIIGTLTNSIYLPLLALVVLATAVWIAWTAVVNRQLRQALWGVVWLFISIILGLTFLFKPAMLAGAPMKISNGLAGCIVSTFTGSNCFTGSSGSGGSGIVKSEDVCRAEGGRNADKIELVAASLSCSTWKAFVLEPYAQGSFGQSFTNLDTSTGSNSNTTLNKAIQKSTRYKGSDFCVSLRANGSLNSMTDSNLRLANPATSKRICNIALYQAFLKTDAEHSGPNGKPIMREGVDTRWYSIVDVAASDDTLWEAWSGNGPKLRAAFLALFASILGSVVIIIIALYAMVYYVASVILMAFAPLFFLLGVHPGKGKKILLGYGEMVISNVLKYVVSALFLIVTLALYGGVLGNSSSLGASLLFVTVLTMALIMYRKEIIELIGRANMGGEKISSAMADRLGDSVRKTRRAAGITAMAGVGAGMTGSGEALGGAAKAVGKAARLDFKGAGEGLRESAAGIGHVASRGYDASKTAAAREMRKPSGPLGAMGAAMFRGFDAATDGNEKAVQARAQASANERAELDNNINGDKGTAFREDVSNLVDKLNSYTDQRESLESNPVSEFDEEAVLRDMSQYDGGDEFGQAVRLSREAEKLEGEITVRVAAGEDVTGLQAEHARAAEASDKIFTELDDSGKLATLEETYLESVNSYNNSVGEHNLRVEAAVTTHAEASQLHASASQDFNSLKEDYMNRERVKVEEELWKEAYSKITPGTQLRDGQVKKIQERIDEVSAKRMAAAGESFEKEYGEKLKLTDSLVSADPPASKKVTPATITVNKEEALPGLPMGLGSKGIPTPRESTPAAPPAAQPPSSPIPTQDDLFSQAPEAPKRSTEGLSPEALKEAKNRFAGYGNKQSGGLPIPQPQADDPSLDGYTPGQAQQDAENEAYREQVRREEERERRKRLKQNRDDELRGE